MRFSIFLCYFVSHLLFTFLGAQSSIIHPELRAAFSSGTDVEAMVLFEAQVRMQPADTRVLVDKAEKGRFVFHRTTENARQSQRQVRSYLDQRGIAYRSINIANLISLKLSAESARDIARMGGVKSIVPNPWVRQRLGSEVRGAASARQAAIEWGVERINAPALWAAGFTGQGATVGGQDTGYEYTHPTLIEQYRGNGTDGGFAHDYNWHDAIHSINPQNSNPDNPCGLDVAFPCDDNNHGTHTMGTMIGDDGQGNQIGVAPSASWIACRNMERGWGTPASYLECFEWFLAPTRIDGSEPDPTRAPHVIANSWSCPEVEGCLPETFELFEIAINNLRAAGVVVVTSAGNDGPQCATISKPPSVFPNAFSVGATDSEDDIANFSSRGPATYNGQTYLQPQVVAPGVNVRSAIRNGGYANFSGTSMAGPHTAGAVALLISALPGLAGNVEAIEDIFRQSAQPLFASQDCDDYAGGDHPNAVYGYGRIDLETAYALGQEVVSTRDVQSAANHFKLFPNPADKVVTVSSVSGPALQQLSLLDLNGRELQRIMANGTASNQLSLDGLAPGVYLLRLKNESGVSVLKMVKQ
jgi:subtilisin family serine protease